MSRTLEIVATITAGAAGSAIAVFALGASLLLVLPATIGIGAIAFVSVVRSAHTTGDVPVTSQEVGLAEPAPVEGSG